MTSARDAEKRGEIIEAENLYQHAEHYTFWSAVLAVTIQCLPVRTNGLRDQLRHSPPESNICAGLEGAACLETLEPFLGPERQKNMASDRAPGMIRAADEASLIEGVAAGDVTALRTLLARHQVRVFRFISRLVGSGAVAEELTNEVFLEVWRNAKNYKGEASAATWILAIAHNRAVSSVRKRREESWNQEAAAALPDAGDDPEVTAQKADKSAILRRCMDALSPAHKGIVDLVYYHEMSIIEVGEILQIPVGTVKTRMFYARKRLSELLKEAGIDRGWP